jgi:hypothetical protein
MTALKKGLLIGGGVAILALALFIFIRFFFVFGEGTKVGELNFFVYKGYVFKTYEGRLIQSGLRTQQAGLQSYVFDFSVTDTSVVRKLEGVIGEVELHYKEYLGTLPWRGMSKYIVTDVKVVGNRRK